MPAKRTATKVAKKVQILIQKPGELPQKMTVPAGTTLGDLSKSLNLESYILTVNGQETSLGHPLKKGDSVRIGVRTKNG